METELDCRKKAMQWYYYQHLTKAEICRRLNRSRPWLDCWLERYDPDDVEGSLSNRKAGPKQAGGHWSAKIRQQVIEMRRLRSQLPYALIVAVIKDKMPKIFKVKLVRKFIYERGTMYPKGISLHRSYF